MYSLDSKFAVWDFGLGLFLQFGKVLAYCNLNPSIYRFFSLFALSNIHCTDILHSNLISINLSENIGFRNPFPAEFERLF